MISSKVILGILILLILSGLIIGKAFIDKREMNFAVEKKVNITPQDTQTEKGQKVKYPQDLTIVLVGDSMTSILGNSDEIRSYLKEFYPKKTVEVLNYGFGSTNLLSVPDRLEKTTFFNREFRPINNILYNLIIIESFGHNPLSEYPLADGLKKQNETLDKIVDIIKRENPNAKIAFLATIAPNKLNYAKGQVDLASDVRAKWAAERTAYIENHIKYAKDHNLGLIDVYHRSMDEDGNGRQTFINEADNIHPSPSGVYLISREIADYIRNARLLE